MTRTVTFEAVARKKTFRTKCDDCCRRFQKTIKVEHTVNPFNRDEATGLPRTKEQVLDRVLAELKQRCDEFLRQPHCNDCSGDA